MSNYGRITILGKLAPPNDVINFTGSWNAMKRVVNLTWSAVDNIDLSHYIIKQGTSWDTASVVVKEAKNESTAVSISEGVSETRTYLIKAVDTSGIYSTNYTSVDVAIDTAECPLLTPTGLNLSTQSGIASDGTDRVTVLASWDANAEVDDNFHHYRLMMEEMSSGHKSTYETENTEYQWEVEPTKEYGITVQAIDVSGNSSPYSAQQTITASKDSTAPATPAWATTALVPGFKVIGLRWQKNSENDLSHYEAQRSTTGSFTGEEVDLGNKDGNFTTDTDLAVDAAYYYRIRAVDTSGNTSGWSTIQNATTLQVGQTDIAANAIVANHIDVSTLSAISANIGTITAGVIQSSDWGASPDDGTQIDLDNNTINIGGSTSPNLSWDGNTLSVQGQINTWNATGDSTKIDGGQVYAGSSVQIGNTDGSSDYCLIDNGDISFYYYFNSAHHLYKSLKRMETGIVASNTTKQLDGYWKTTPKIIVSPAVLDVYSESYSNQSQKLDCKATNIIETATTGVYQFDAVAELQLSSGETAVTVNDTFGGTSDGTTYSSATETTVTNVTSITVNYSWDLQATMLFTGPEGDCTVTQTAHLEYEIYVYIDGASYKVRDFYDYGAGDVADSGSDSKTYNVSAGTHDIQVKVHITQLDTSSCGTSTPYCNVIFGSYSTNITSATTLASGTLNYFAIGE